MRTALRCALVCLVVVPLDAVASPAVFADGRDAYTLLDRHPVNRQLFEQLSAPEQDFRLGRYWERFAIASDLVVGTQQTPGSSPQSRFHGYYIADTYAAVRALDGLDANLNLTLWNPSASDGYRVSSQISAGLAIHGYFEPFQVDDDPVRLDIVGTDLGWMTVGRGLLLEQIPLEGVLGAVSWGDFELRYMYGGRAFWDDDDVIETTLRAFDGLADIRFLQWQRKGETDSPFAPAAPAIDPGEAARSAAYYIGASVDIPIAPGARVAGEYAARLREPIRSALLARTDLLYRVLPWLDVHGGYQFRWYENGVGPRDEIRTPTLPFNLPFSEDVYVTNSFEYFGLSSAFEQWSHTVMAEARATLVPELLIFAETEVWLRYAAAALNPPLVVYTPSEFRAPGRDFAVFYKAGLRLVPWRGYPHRVNGFLTNKQVLGELTADIPVSQRYDPGTYAVLELEAFL